MTWRISKSRPSTGSILPCLARSVRLTVYWSRFGVLPPPGRGRRRPARGALRRRARARRIPRTCRRRWSRNPCAAPPAESSASSRLTSCDHARRAPRSRAARGSCGRCESAPRRSRASRSSTPRRASSRACGLKAGVRALPVFSWSRLFVSSDDEPRSVDAVLLEDRTRDRRRCCRAASSDNARSRRRSAFATGRDPLPIRRALRAWSIQLGDEGAKIDGHGTQGSCCSLGYVLGARC